MILTKKEEEEEESDSLHDQGFPEGSSFIEIHISNCCFVVGNGNPLTRSHCYVSNCRRFMSSYGALHCEDESSRRNLKSRSISAFTYFRLHLVTY